MQLRELSQHRRWRMYAEFLRSNSEGAVDEWDAMEQVIEKIVRQNPALDRARVRQMIGDLRAASIR